MPAPKIEARTARAIDALKPTETAYVAIVDNSLMLRVAADGRKTFLVRYWVGGRAKQYTLPQQYGSGVGQISLKDAEAEARRIQALGRAGTDWPAEQAARLAAKVADGLTVREAFEDFLERKRRVKDRLPLSQRTRDDYTGMLDRELAKLAGKQLARLTAAEIRKAHENIVGERRKDYAMAALRAVMRWHAVSIDGDPFAKTTRGSDRIAVRPVKGNPSPIPMPKLGAWWKAAQGYNNPAGQALRFQLLTGARPGEITDLTVGDVDLRAGRVTLRDTKNRTDHVVLLSRQAYRIAELAALLPRGEDKKRPPAGAPLFDVVDPRKTLRLINKAAETPEVSQHKLRHTFGTLADLLVPAGVVRRMINHAGGDVTERHYIGVSDGVARRGWQTVADALDEAAAGKVLGDDEFDEDAYRFW